MEQQFVLHEICQDQWLVPQHYDVVGELGHGAYGAVWYGTQSYYLILSVIYVPFASIASITLCCIHAPSECMHTRHGTLLRLSCSEFTPRCNYPRVIPRQSGSVIYPFIVHSLKGNVVNTSNCFWRFVAL
eukprot:m.28502 g.28502  ORF g.28502 m.28502 type:complete len:130 (+) comp9044_c0_seq3:131-520(+)